MTISIVLKKTPDGLMLQFGSLTAWNTGLELDTTVVWQKSQCRVMGTASQGIRTTEDRDLFAIACKEIGESFCESIACASVAVCIDTDGPYWWMHASLKARLLLSIPSIHL